MPVAFGNLPSCISTVRLVISTLLPQAAKSAAISSRGMMRLIIFNV